MSPDATPSPTADTGVNIRQAVPPKNRAARRRQLAKLRKTKRFTAGELLVLKTMMKENG